MARPTARIHIVIVTASVLASCRANPIEREMALVGEGRCAEAMAGLVEASARGDAWGASARALRARCAVLVAGGETADPAALARAVEMLAGCLEDVEPRDVDPVTPVELGRAVEELMGLHLEAGRCHDVLGVQDAFADRAELSIASRALAGKARLCLGSWARAAADLEAAAGGVTGDREKADLFRLASGSWHLAGQPEKALVDFSRARKLGPLAWEHPQRLIPEGQEFEHVLGELIAAAVHGILVQSFTLDWDALTGEPRKFNFFLSEKRQRTFLEADEEVETLRQVIARGGNDPEVESAPWLLYQILNMRGLVRAAGGDYAGARVDLEQALLVLPGGAEASANLSLLGFWVHGPEPAPLVSTPPAG